MVDNISQIIGQMLFEIPFPNTWRRCRVPVKDNVPVYLWTSERVAASATWVSEG